MARTTTAAEAVAGEIRAELARRQLTIAWLADELAMSRSTLNRKVNCARALTIDDAVACAQVLGIGLDRLFSHTPSSEQAAA
jgi:plasmid maintenance system antidote protein VapI